MNQEYFPSKPDTDDTSNPTILLAIGADGKFKAGISHQPTIYAQSSFHVGRGSATETKNIEQEDEMSANGLISKIEFRVAMALALLTVIGAAVAASWSISNSISDKNNQLRQEVNQNILTSKQEVTQRIDRVEDKIDSGFKDTSNQLSDLKVILATRKSEDKGS